MRLPEGQALWSLVRPGLLSSAESGVADYGGGRLEKKEIGFLVLGFKSKFYPSPKDPRFPGERKAKSPDGTRYLLEKNQSCPLSSGLVRDESPLEQWSPTFQTSRTTG